MTDEISIGKKTVRDIDVRAKRVLVRADLNVPIEDGHVADDTRIEASLPTIRYLLERGAAVIVCSHLGRPKGKPDPAFTLQPVAVRLAERLGKDVRFVEDCAGPAAEAVAGSLEPGEVALLENLRFHPGEEANDEAFAQQLAALADVYVNDAFGAAHRAHASTVGVAKFLPAVAGFLLEKEVRYLGALIRNPPKPFAVVIGGAKVSTKIAAIKNLLPALDLLLLGGGMANTFLKATGFNTGASLVEDDHVETARQILEQATRLDRTVILPADVVAAERFAEDARHVTVPVDAVPAGYMILDIGPRTLEMFVDALRSAKAVIWNGPMGVFEMEPFAAGSFGLAKALAGLDAVTVVGGGETAAVVSRAGVADRVTHVSTGGGASLEMLEGRELPGVNALLDA